MANPLSFPSLVSFVARLADRVTALERRRAAPVPATLDDLDDTEVKYGHADAPQNGYVLTWDSTRSSPFGGLATFAPSVASRSCSLCRARRSSASFRRQAAR